MNFVSNSVDNIVPLMSDTHLETLMSSKEQLSSALTLTEPIWVAVKVPFRLKCAIECEKTVAQMNKTFIDILAKRPDLEYLAFVEALRDIGQDNVAVILKPGSLFRTSTPLL